MLAFIDEKLGGRGFVLWKPYDHTVYGEVEIGGLGRSHRRHHVDRVGPVDLDLLTPRRGGTDHPNRGRRVVLDPEVESPDIADRWGRPDPGIGQRHATCGGRATAAGGQRHGDSCDADQPPCRPPGQGHPRRAAMSSARACGAIPGAQTTRRAPSGPMPIRVPVWSTRYPPSASGSPSR